MATGKTALRSLALAASLRRDEGVGTETPDRSVRGREDGDAMYAGVLVACRRGV